MSVNRKRTHGRDGRRLAYAATNRTLGQQPQRNRRIDRPVTRQNPPDREPSQWRADIARILLDAPQPTVPRRVLRAAMPDLGPEVQAYRGHSNGRRSSRKLSAALADWEGRGWVRRNGDDTVTVLDRDALRRYADHLDPVSTSREAAQPGGRPAEVIARALADAIAAGDREATTRLTSELQAAEDHDPQRLATWARAIRSRLAAESIHPQLTEDGPA